MTELSKKEYLNNDPEWPLNNVPEWPPIFLILNGPPKGHRVSIKTKVITDHRTIQDQYLKNPMDREHRHR